MKIKNVFNIILCCILVATSLPFSVSAADDYENVEYVPGEIVITTEDELIDSSSAFVTFSNNDYTMINFEEEEITEVEKVSDYNESTTDNTYVLNVEGNILEKCKELEALPGVKYAEPNLIFHTMGFSMPNEINYGSLYKTHMKWYFDLLQIPDAWQDFETTGEGVVVAVIDNGYKLDVTDFPTNLWTDENGNHGWNTYKDSADISPIYRKDGTAYENTGHGNHVAGVIGAPANNSNLIGAAYNAQLMLINAAHYVSETEAPNFTLDDLLDAIDYAIDNGADIINMSLGLLGGQSSQLEDRVNNAYNNGIAVIAAAGNSGASTSVAQAIPAAYENVIGVMASDKTDPTQLAKFSNYDPSGKYYDIVAPGYQLLSCSVETGKVAYMSGTSQASPLVAACAALYLSEYPNATVDELYEAIRNSPTSYIKSNSDVVTDTTYNFKLLNAPDLLRYGKIKPQISTNLNTNVTIVEDLGYIWGLDEGFSDISNYITVTEGTGTLEYIPSENGIGTGSVVNVYDIYGELFKSYTVIVFGDVNGDTYIDGQDAVLISCITTFTDKFTEAQKFAADVDFDNSVTETDYSITANKALLLDFVSQIK